MKYSIEELKKILDEHTAWLINNENGKCANLGYADLHGANLGYANLRSADLYGADLRSADLYGANLRSADLYGANLRSANLYGANLYGANLRSANLYGANLRSANLYGADLRSADLYGANLRSADLRGIDVSKFQIVPEVGGFTAFKKLKEGIAELYIPRSAKRVGGLLGRKCRVSKAKVKSIIGLDGKPLEKGTDKYSGALEYKVGEWVKPDKFDGDVRVECTNGIHIFITKKEAEEY